MLLARDILASMLTNTIYMHILGRGSALLQKESDTAREAEIKRHLLLSAAL